MKKRFRFISVLLIVAMALTMLPMSPFALNTEATNLLVAAANPSVSPAAAPAPPPFRITEVEVINNRVAIVHLSNEVNTHFEMFSHARPNYLTYFLRLNGMFLHNNKEVMPGVDSRMYLREDRMSFELVLGSAESDLQDTRFVRFTPGNNTLQFDWRSRDFIPYYYFFQEDQMIQSGDVWVRDIHDQPLSSAPFHFNAGGAAINAAPFLEIEEARILDSRAIYVRFNQRITLPPLHDGQSMIWATSSLLTGPYAARGTEGANSNNLGNIYNIVPVGGGAALQLAYSFQIPRGHPEATAAGDGGGREFILYYAGDILEDVEYEINWTSNAWNAGRSQPQIRGLINAAGLNGTPTLTATLDARPSVPPSNFDLLSVTLNRSVSGREELELVFDRPMAFTRIAEESRFRTRNRPNEMPWTATFHDRISAAAEDDSPLLNPNYLANRTAYFQSLTESGTGMTGAVLTADDLREILTLTGVNAITPGGTVPFLNAFFGDHVVGYFRNNHTIVIHNQNRFPIALTGGANVTVQAGALVGFGTRNTWSAGSGIGGGGLEDERPTDRVGVLQNVTNGPRNTPTTATVTVNPVVAPWGPNWDPDWPAYGEGAVTITPTYALFNHNDVFHLQYDGERNPLIGGFSGDVRHVPNLTGGRLFAPDGRQFGGNYRYGVGQPIRGLGVGSGNSTLELSYVVQGRYPAYNVENRWIRALIVPSNTARFLEFEFKPTGHDAHYTNPAATNYNVTGQGHAFPPTNIGGGTFLLSWLLVWGGTFPVFEGCEHGHVWTTPWEYEIVHNPDGQPAGSISIRHTITNDQNAQVSAGGFVPSSNNVGIGGDFTPFSPGLEYTVEYIIRPNDPTVDMAVTVHNPAAVARTYEYYTCNTWAPGELSQWGHGSMKHIDNNQVCMVQNWPAGNVAVNNNTGEMSNDRTASDVLHWSRFNFPNDMPLAHYLPQWIRDRIYSPGDRFGTAANYNQNTGEVNRNHFYEWYTTRYIVGNDLLTTFSTDLNRRPQADWYGGVNLRNLEGIMRAGPDLNQSTPSIKYWLWGYRHMFDNLPFERTSNNSGRPYLEPWAGVGDQYFSNRAIGPGETHHWVETYYHTFGLDMATNSNENGMAHIKFYEHTATGMVQPVVEIYDTKLLQTMTARMTAPGGLSATWTYTSRPMAHEVFVPTWQVAEDGARILVEVFAGATATGTPVLTAWAYSGRPFVRIGSTPAWRGPSGNDIDAWTDRDSPVQSVHISHSEMNSPFASAATVTAGLPSIDVPGRVATTGNVQYRFREVFAWAEPFSADGKGIVIWEKFGPQRDELTVWSGVSSPGHTAPSTGPRGVPHSVNTGQDASWWHTFDFITLRGHAPGSRVVLRAISGDENLPANHTVWEDIVVYVREPLYLTLPYNPGNAAGTTDGHSLARNMYSPYRFNMDMNLELTITDHEDANVAGPITVSIYHRNNQYAEPFITFEDLTLGENMLHIPAYTFPREEYYRIVARSANGLAFGYEFFRVDGYSDIDWNHTLFTNGTDVFLRFDNKNSNIAATLGTVPGGATAFINNQPFPVEVGILTDAATSNTNTLTIPGGAAALVSGDNFVDVVGIVLPDYPDNSVNISRSWTRP